MKTTVIAAVALLAAGCGPSVEQRRACDMFNEAVWRLEASTPPVDLTDNKTVDYWVKAYRDNIPHPNKSVEEAARSMVEYQSPANQAGRRAGDIYDGAVAAVSARLALSLREVGEIVEAKWCRAATVQLAHLPGWAEYFADTPGRK